MNKFKIASEHDLNIFGNHVLEELNQNPDIKIIGIDGAMQSGKSKIIREHLINVLNAELIDIDKLIKIDETSIIYVESEILVLESKVYIADGILNKEVLQHFNIQPDLNIYVKKMANYGWVERDWLEKEFISDYGIDETYKQSSIDRQIFRYHNQYEPVKNADVIVEVAEYFVTRDFY